MNDDHDEYREHCVEDAFVVGLLDPRVQQEQVEERVPGSHDVALEQESLLDFDVAAARSCDQGVVLVELLALVS